MILKMYSIYDIKGQLYAPPYFANNIGSATRMFDGACRDPNTQLAKYPEDFRLFELGEFDDNTGRFTCPDQPTFVIGASDITGKLLQKENNNGSKDSEKV